MTPEQRAAYGDMLAVARGLIADLNGLAIDIQRGAPVEHVAARLALYANQGAERVTAAGGQLYLALSAAIVQHEDCAES